MFEGSEKDVKVKVKRTVNGTVSEGREVNSVEMKE